jgi:hypothetical protein
MPEERPLSEAAIPVSASNGAWAEPVLERSEEALVTYRSLLRNPNFRMLWLSEAFS